MITLRLAVAAAEDNVSDERPQLPAPLCWSTEELAAALGLAIRTSHKMNSTGKLPRPARFGRAVRWRVAEIQAWLAVEAPSQDRWEDLRS
jgi:predicted DNA-binding transcriptional regulator AlpA